MKKLQVYSTSQSKIYFKFSNLILAFTPSHKLRVWNPVTRHWGQYVTLLRKNKLLYLSINNTIYYGKIVAPHTAAFIPKQAKEVN